MGGNNVEEWLTAVLSAYGLHQVSATKISGNLYKIEDGFQAYALKKSRLSDKELDFFSHVYWLANSLQLRSILPVYLTTDGQIVYKWQKHYFYLTPWLESTRPFRDKEIQDFYENIATIHSKTKRPRKIELQSFKDSFLSYQTYCKDCQIHLERYVQLFEQKEYMSPFELLVCTQYRDVAYAFFELNKRLNQFLHEDTAFTWSSSLCHMNLKTSHLFDSYIINWEKARLENAVADLAVFFRNETKKHGRFGELLQQNFHAYMNVNKLTEKELQLLLIYLLSISNYLSVIQQYVSKTSQETMVEQIIRLQHEYRNILFGIQFSQYVEKEFETVSAEDINL